MDRQVAWKLGVIAAATALVCLFLLLMCPQRPYSRSPASLDSEEVQQSLDMLRRIAADPRSVSEFMSAQASKQARVAVAAAAVQMGRASPPEFKNAAWFGKYLRVGVTYKAPDGRLIERYFFLREEDGELRITGLEQ